MHTQWRRAASAAAMLAILFSPLAQASRRRATRTPTSATRDSLFRILTLENQRNGKDPYLAIAIHHPTPTIRQAALFAAGRVGEASLVGEMSEFLNRRHGPAKSEVIFALGMIPDESALTIAIQHLAMQQDPQVLSDLYVAIGRAGGEKNVPLFATAIQSSASPKVIEGACFGLGHLWAKESENWAVPTGLVASLLQRVRQSETLAAACGFALSRFKGTGPQIPPNEAVKAAEQVKAKDSLAFLIRLLAKVHTPESDTFLILKAAPFMQQPTRVEALKALSAHAVTKPILATLKSALEASQSAVVYQALDGLQGYGADAKEIAPAILALYQKTKSTWLQGKALRAGVAADPLLFKPLVLKEINDPKSPLRASAAAALAVVPAPEDGTLIATLLAEPSIRLVLDLLESLSAWPEDAFTEPVQKGLRACLDRKDPALTASVASIVERFKWKAFGQPLVSAYQSLNKPDLVESKVAVLAALGSLGDSGYLPLMESALKDPDKLVVAAAAEGIRVTASRDESGKIPLNSKPPAFAFTMAEVEEALRSQIVLKTTRGDILLAMAKEAPLNAVNFVRLVRDKKFYDGLTFHRVVPGFVAQGGDPRGDGFGGPGYLVRDEVSPRRHLRGTVGLATSGKDTGGSQFFVNLSNNHHLDGRYTVIGQVTQGMDVADKLEVGDKILSARILR